MEASEEERSWQAGKSVLKTVLNFDNNYKAFYIYIYTHVRILLTTLSAQIAQIMTREE